MFKSARWLLCFVFILAYAPVYAEINDSSIKVLWDYEGQMGPANWAQLSPSFALCANGKMQSPISISKRASSTPATLAFYYESAPMMIVEDGLTDLMLGQTETIIADGHGLQLDFPEDTTKESIMFYDNLYRLVQLHIHMPSEHQLYGQSYPMEIHFVHQGNDGAVVVVGVLVKYGESNTLLEKIIEHLPPDKGVEHTVEGVDVNPATAIPPAGSREYYSYSGSLTTPPCTEGVEWIVMANPITASSAQIAKLRHAVEGDNARSLQGLKKRRVYFSKR